MSSGVEGSPTLLIPTLLTPFVESREPKDGWAQGLPASYQLKPRRMAGDKRSEPSAKWSL